MKKIISSVIAATFLISTAGAALADNENWTEEKQAQIEQNRFANSGLGNGGEKANGSPKANEVGTGPNPDVDPGNSGAQCQGGKNNELNGDSC